MINFILFMAALAVLYKMLSAVASFSHTKWRGHEVHFSLLTLAYAGMGAGALGTAAGVEFGPAFMLLGLAGVMLTDRRGAR